MDGEEEILRRHGSSAVDVADGTDALLRFSGQLSAQIATRYHIILCIVACSRLERPWREHSARNKMGLTAWGTGVLLRISQCHEDEVRGCDYNDGGPKAVWDFQLAYLGRQHSHLASLHDAVPTSLSRRQSPSYSVSGGLDWWV